MEQRRGYCDDCERWVGTQRPQINGIGHLILIVCTLGLWLIPYFFIATAERPWRCAVCQSTRVRSEERQQRHWAALDAAKRGEGMAGPDYARRRKILLYAVDVALVLGGGAYLVHFFV